ncbi:hypothetical protein CN992_28070, partial [Bacillus thuringiensis]
RQWVNRNGRIKALLNVAGYKNLCYTVLKLNEGVVYDLIERHLCDFGRAVLIIIYLYCKKPLLLFE